MSCLCLSRITYERKVVFPTLSSPNSNMDIGWASITSFCGPQQSSGQSLGGGGCGLYIHLFLIDKDFILNFTDRWMITA